MSSNESVFSGICNSPLWDQNVTWDTATPAFTPCFTDTVLRWSPAAFLWIFFPYTLFDFLTARRPSIRWNCFNIVKLATSLTLFLLGLAHVIYEGVLWNGEDRSTSLLISRSEVIGTVVTCATYCLLCCNIHLQRVYGFVNGGAIWFYLGFQIFCSAISIPSYVHFDGLYQTKGELALCYLELAFQVILFLICSFADQVPNLKEIMSSDALYGDEANKEGFIEGTQGKEKKICPKETASFPSKLTFWWFNTIVWTGYRRPLTMDDLWQIRLTDRARKMFDEFNHFWGHKPFSDSNFATNNQQTHQEFNGKAKLSGKSYQLNGGLKGQNVVINSFMIIVKQFWPYFLYPSIARLVTDNLQLVNPTIMKYMISFTTDFSAPFWHGIFYSLIFVVINVATSLTSAFHQYRMSVLGMRIRAALIGAVYRKSLVLASHSKKLFTSGEIVNLMAVDSQRFVDLLPWFCFLWTAPIQIGITLWLLWNELGIAVLGGLVVMVLLIPVNGVIAGFVKQIQTRQMGLKDKRLKAINEMLNGMKVLKLYAWEQAFIDNIQAIRVEELNHVRKSGYISTIFNLISACTPFMVSCLTFAIYIWIDSNNVLTAQKAFVSIAYFNMLRMPMTMIPNMMSNLIMTMVSVKRLNKFLNSDETTPYIERNPDPVNAISVSNGSFNWEQVPEEKLSTINPTLSSIDLNITKNRLVAIVGSVGSGKSSLLAALLGEMQRLSGQVNISSELALAYVPQQAWIQNATVRENIIFGRTLSEKKYHRVIDACALKPDFAMLTGGDETEIGEKGINLSGGQKQRVSIARACYSDADLYLFDDPLSAVDSHVGKHIFDQVLSSDKGILKNKTRVLVTNALYMLPNVDQIVLLKSGSIEAVGSYEQLMKSSATFADLIANYSKSAAEEEVEEVKEPSESDTLKIEEDVTAEFEDRTIDDFVEAASATPVGSLRLRKPSKIFKERNHSLLSGSSSKLSTSIHTEKPPGEQEKAKSNLIQAELLETGTINMRVFMRFLSSMSYTWSLVIVVSYAAMTTASTGSSFWLNTWTADQDVDNAGYYLLRYFLIGLAQAVFVAVGWISVVTGTMRASRTLHWKLLNSIVHAPMHFFDTTPLGRIVNRFSKDFDVLDTFIQLIISILLNTTFGVIATFFTVSYQTPLFMAVVVPFLVVYLLIQRFYVATSRQLKRLESITRSPIFTHFSETITGVSTIKAYTAAERFMVEFDRRVDSNQRAFFPSALAISWLQVRLEAMANVLIFCASLFVALSKDSNSSGGLTGGDTGLSLSYALNITTALNMTVRFFTELENQVVCVERISEYTEVEPEAAWFRDEDSKLGSDWPPQGVIGFEGYGTRYRPGLDLVLRRIDISTGAGEKIGIVGRTGAGKSSLTLALFRIIEAAHGNILIDGMDIAKLGLQTLRSRITIIPQDPVLFCGTIRLNLDPFDTYTDDQLWHVLSLSHLKPFVASLEQGLQYPVAEAGENLSVGQRQLICLARALLRKTRLLILDEATAAVDLETDSLIQATIREQFSHCTVLTIAHRLHTIMDSDRVMVLDAGNVAEFESPKNLLSNNSSIFYSLARDAGIV